MLLAYAMTVTVVHAWGSSNPSISADGQSISFSSAESEMILGDVNGAGDIFFRNLTTLETTRVSVDSEGDEAIGGSSGNPSISSDGRYIAFTSSATNLVASDTNGQRDIFLHDTQNNTTTRVSVVSGGAEAIDGDSNNPSISSDGRYIAFTSSATNLVASDTNGQSDIFLHDTQLGTTTRVSVDSVGAEGDFYSSGTPSISSDGRYIAFTSSATNLVAGDANGQSDIFLHDTQNNTTTRVSVDSAGLEAGGISDSPSISSDGRYIAFASHATNLVASDTNGQSDIFLHDTQNNTTTRVSIVSIVSGGAQATGGQSYGPSISSDGRYIAFTSSATNLVAGDANGQSDIFLHDTQNNTTTRVSVDSAGLEAGGISDSPSISSDGRYIAFTSEAANLVSNDMNGVLDVFLHDTQTTETILVSRGSNSVISYTGSFTESLANDGSLEGSITATMPLSPISDFWNISSKDNTAIFLEDTHFTLTNKPAGLTAVMEIDGTSAVTIADAVLTFTGNATNHEDVNDVSNLTITFLDDAFVGGNASDVINYEYTEGEIDFEGVPVVASTRRSSSSSSPQSRAKAKAAFAKHYGIETEEPTTTSTTTATSTTELSESNTCSLEQTLTQNLKAPSRNGTYNSYTNDIVTEAHILQAHLNRLGFNSGPEDGILGPISTGAIKRMQTFLGTDPDGYVGPLTRAFINESCGEGGLSS